MIPTILAACNIISNNDGGMISVFEICKKYNINAKRLYFLNSSSKTIDRGGHAHKKLLQLIICVKGESKIELINQNQKNYLFELNDPTSILLVPKLHWRNIELKDNSSLLVLATEEYNENDYIRDFNSFLNYENTISTN